MMFKLPLLYLGTLEDRRLAKRGRSRPVRDLVAWPTPVCLLRASSISLPGCRYLLSLTTTPSQPSQLPHTVAPPMEEVFPPEHLHPLSPDVEAAHAPPFDPTFTPSKTAKHLDPADLPIAKTRRAWEREPQSPFARGASYNKVWKRYGTRSLARKENELQVPHVPSGGLKESARIVKRLRLARVENGGGDDADGVRHQTKVVSYEATKWERRRGSLPRMCLCIATRGSHSSRNSNAY